VWSGDTFGALVRLLHRWTLHTRRRDDWRAVRARLRVVAITEQDYSIRNGWRYQQRRASGGEEQLKVAESHTPQRWDDERAAQPSRRPERARAARAAVEIFRRARDRLEREQFITELARHGALRDENVRKLTAELRFGRRPFPTSLPLPGTPGRGLGRGAATSSTVRFACERGSAIERTPTPRPTAPSPLPSPRSTGKRELHARRPSLEPGHERGRNWHAPRPFAIMLDEERVS
jgi:hypothetical protein